MTTPPSFPGFDGLMTLSRREGVDIRPTLLRVLTDLYVQANAHTSDEERQFVELTSRLIDAVDDGTRAAVRARLAVYPGTPADVLKKLGLEPASSRQSPLPGPEIHLGTGGGEQVVLPVRPGLRIASTLSMQPKDAAEITNMFSRASGSERTLILHNLQEAPLRASARIPAARAKRAIETLEMAAFAADLENFTLELGDSLILPWRVASELVNDPGGEPLACAGKALNMPLPVFQRILLFLRPEFGSSVQTVYRLSRLYERLSERSALVMLAAWRGATMAVTRAKFRPGLYDDESSRPRSSVGQARPSAVQPGSGIVKRTGSEG
jgi:Uncharacterised protein conserved in bacteria (DUF2336)